MRNRSLVSTSSRGSNVNGRKSNNGSPMSSSARILLSHLLTFLTGCTVSFLLLSMQPASPLLKTSSSSVSSSSGCEISLGTYRGHEYRTETGGTVGQAKCLVESKFLKVQQHSVRMPNDETGTIIPDWIWIDYHDRINVLVEAEPADTDTEQHFLVFEQTKYALEGRMSLAIVGGIIEPHEDPEHAARREVEEEMGGLHCQKFHFLGRYRTDVNRGMGWTNTFLAAQCSKNGPRIGTMEGQEEAEEVGVADTERQDLKRIGLSELREAVVAGKFLEIQWSATIALALLHTELAV